MKLEGLARAVQKVYTADPDRPVSNEMLYPEVARQMELDFSEAFKREPIGSSKSMRSRFERQVRWTQQTMRVRGVLQKSEARRGEWVLTEFGKKRLQRLENGKFLVAFNTNLGLAILGDCVAGLSGLPEEIHLSITSPPYPLQKERFYGNPNQNEYVDFICAAIEPIVNRLARGGSIVLNVSNDIFEQGSPARSLYRERLVLALHDRLGLKKMDEIIWHNPSKPPGPVQWASIKRTQLNVAYEPLLWMCNEPLECFADNRRVLEPHTGRHSRFLASGARDETRSSDGAHSRRLTSYGAVTEGRIPRNVLSIPHHCQGQKDYKAYSRSRELMPHGAPYPERLVDFIVRFLTEEGMLVADPFGGSLTTAAVCEKLSRRWITAEMVFDYIAGGLSRFVSAPGLWVNPDLALV